MINGGNVVHQPCLTDTRDTACNAKGRKYAPPIQQRVGKARLSLACDASHIIRHAYGDLLLMLIMPDGHSVNPRERYQRVAPKRH